MVEILQSSTYKAWFEDLRDAKARARILVRVTRLSLGNPGDVKPVGSGVSEMRIDYGPGYRVYYAQHGKAMILLCCGGDKSTQAANIKEAIAIAKAWKEE